MILALNLHEGGHVLLSKDGTNQLIHLFLGGKGLGIQQGMSVWVGLPKFAKVVVSNSQPSNYLDTYI